MRSSTNVWLFIDDTNPDGTENFLPKLDKLLQLCRDIDPGADNKDWKITFHMILIMESYHPSSATFLHDIYISMYFCNTTFDVVLSFVF